MTRAAPTTVAATAEPDDGTITAETLATWAAGADHAPLVIDVRSAAEYDTTHIRGSYQVPLATLAEHARELAGHLDRGEPVVLVCRSGARADQARRHLAAVGLSHARVLAGGVPAFDSAGGEVVRGRRTWALERQVRLAAGALMVTGLVAGRLICARARLLSLGIGAGLAVSAITDTCAMGAALARLPWNRDRTEPTAADVLDRVACRAPQD